MEMLGGFSDLLWTDQQGNGGQGMGAGCWTVIGAPEPRCETLIWQRYTCAIHQDRTRSRPRNTFKKKKNVCCQVKKKKKKTVTHLTTKSAFRMDSLGHERFGSEGQRTC